MCLLTSELMFAHAFAWSKTIKNKKMMKKLFSSFFYVSLLCAWWKKTLFKSFLNVFDRFWPCERMRKHAFAGRNTQQATILKPDTRKLIMTFRTLFLSELYNISPKFDGKVIVSSVESILSDWFRSLWRCAPNILCSIQEFLFCRYSFSVFRPDGLLLPAWKAIGTL